MRARISLLQNRLLILKRDYFIMSLRTFLPLLLTAISIPICDSYAKSKGEKVIRYQCGACHISSMPTANKEALKIFNLDDPFWVSKMSERRKNEFIVRLQDRITMTDLEVSYLMPRGLRPLPKRPTKSDVLEVQLYLSEASKKIDLNTLLKETDVKK